MKQNQISHDIQIPTQKQITGNNVFVNFFGTIHTSNVQNLMNCFLQLSGQNPSSISFLFSSPGGDVSSGITLYNFLKTLPTNIATYNMGSVDSIAIIIFLAGNERYACPNSTFLFHGTTCTIPTSQPLRLDTIREIESRIAKDEEKIAGIIAENTEIKKEEIENLFRQGASKDLLFAKEKGVINEVKSPRINNSLCINITPHP